MINNNFLFYDFLDYSEKLEINNFENFSLTKFQIWQHQLSTIKKLLNKKQIVSLSDRKMGVTTLMLIFAHWFSNKYSNSNILFVSSSLACADQCKAQFIFLDKNEINFENGSNIIFESTESLKDGRSYDIILIDNAAYIKEPNSLLTYLCMQQKPNKYSWINSDSLNKNSWFYKIYSSTKPNNKVLLPRRKFKIWL